MVCDKLGRKILGAVDRIFGRSRLVLDEYSRGTNKKQPEKEMRAVFAAVFYKVDRREVHWFREFGTAASKLIANSG